MRMNSTAKIGLKITAAQREYYRYTGTSAELEKLGGGSSQAGQVWVRRARQQDEKNLPDADAGNSSSSDS